MRSLFPASFPQRNSATLMGVSPCTWKEVHHGSSTRSKMYDALWHCDTYTILKLYIHPIPSCTYTWMEACGAPKAAEFKATFFWRSSTPGSKSVSTCGTERTISDPQKKFSLSPVFFLSFLSSFLFLFLSFFSFFLSFLFFFSFFLFFLSFFLSFLFFFFSVLFFSFLFFSFLFFSFLSFLFFSVLFCFFFFSFLFFSFPFLFLSFPSFFLTLTISRGAPLRKHPRRRKPSQPAQCLHLASATWKRSRDQMKWA